MFLFHLNSAVYLFLRGKEIGVGRDASVEGLVAWVSGITAGLVGGSGRPVTLLWCSNFHLGLVAFGGRVEPSLTGGGPS